MQLSDFKRRHAQRTWVTIYRLRKCAIPFLVASTTVLLFAAEAS